MSWSRTLFFLMTTSACSKDGGAPPSQPPAVEHDPAPPKPEPELVVAESVIVGMAKLEDGRAVSYIDTHEVTVADYRRCVDAGKCDPPSTDPPCDGMVNNWLNRRDLHPVNCVGMGDAMRYCRSLGKRLPSLLEHEAATPKEKPTCKTAVLRGCGDAGTSPVGSKPEGRSAAGIVDLIGNVAELGVHGPGTPVDYTRLPRHEQTTVYGGSYADDPNGHELHIGFADVPSPMVGFRCASNVPGGPSDRPLY